MVHTTTFGSGIKLDEDWDLVVDSTGDLDHTVDSAELQKDLAFVSAQELEAFYGGPINETTRGRIRLKLTDVFTDDPRISEVTSLSVQDTEDITDEITIEVTLIADDGAEYDFVIQAHE